MNLREKSHEEEKISLRKLRNLEILLLHFSTMKPEEIIFCVFANYFNLFYQLEKVVGLDEVRNISLKQVDVVNFTKRFKKFFKDEEADKLVLFCRDFGEKFSVGELVFGLLMTRKFKPN